MAFQYFSQHFHNGLLDKIIDISRQMAQPADRTRIKVSSKAYSEAFSEADFDAFFLKSRRGLANGVSEGKLTGVLFFRMCRHKIINLSHEIVDHPDYEHFQEKIMIKIIGSLMHLDFNDPWIKELIGKPRPSGMRLNFQNIHNELLFVTCRRHYNQESLALFFDTFAFLSHAMEEIRTLKPQAPPKK